MTEETKEDFRGAGRVAFIARKEKIKEMIDAGHPIKNVYRKYRGEVNISYGQFSRYVNTLIKNATHENQGKQPAAEPEKKEVIKKPEYGQPKFVRNENRDDLIKPKPKE